MKKKITFARTGGEAFQQDIQVPWLKTAQKRPAQVGACQTIVAGARLGHRQSFAMEQTRKELVQTGII